MDRTEGISHAGFHAGSFSARDESRVAAKAARRRVRIMSATLHRPLPHHEPVAPPAARLALKTDDGTSRGLLEGPRRPRSRELLSRLPALIHRLDIEHAERIAVHRYGGALPGDPRCGTDAARPPAGPPMSKSPTVGDRRDHRDGGRGRFPPRRRRDRTTHHG
ncbi:hypothetical protein ACWGKQ_34490 [Streptomyces sp. NPDC054770]